VAGRSLARENSAEGNWGEGNKAAAEPNPAARHKAEETPSIREERQAVAAGAWPIRAPFRKAWRAVTDSLPVRRERHRTESAGLAADSSLQTPKAVRLEIRIARLRPGHWRAVRKANQRLAMRQTAGQPGG